MHMYMFYLVLTVVLTIEIALNQSDGIIVLGNTCSCYPFFCGKVFNNIDLKRCSRCNTLLAPEQAQMLKQSHWSSFFFCVQ